MAFSPLAQLVLHDRGASYDHPQMLSIRCEKCNVLQRIAVDHQQVGVRARRRR